jgi:hypothetical protein
MTTGGMMAHAVQSCTTRKKNPLLAVRKLGFNVSLKRRNIMSSKSYNMGYKDAYTGELCTPPTGPFFQQEYCRGYAVAVRDFDDSFPDFPTGTNDAHFDCHYA